MRVSLIQQKASWNSYEIQFKKALSRLKKKDIQGGIFGDIDLQDHRDWVERVCEETGLQAKSSYKDGTWRVLFTRSLTTADAEKDLQFAGGKFIPVAFAAWDGSNSEAGSRHTMTTWYWMLMKPAPSSTPLILALLVGGLLFGGLLWWARGASRKEENA